MKNNGNILIVEPNNGLLTSLRILLKKLFEKVQATDNLQQAEGLLAIDDFDVVLMDLDLFKTRGEATGKIAPFHEKSSNPEIVFLSTFAQVPMAAEAIGMGAFDFVHKPWNEHEIVVSLCNAITKREHKLKIADLENKIEKYQLEIRQLRNELAETRMKTEAVTPIQKGGSSLQNIVENNSRTIEHYSIQTDNFGIAADETLETIEQRIINSVMARNRGNISLTAQQLGITRQTLYNKLKRGNK